MIVTPNGGWEIFFFSRPRDHVTSETIWICWNWSSGRPGAIHVRPMKKRRGFRPAEQHSNRPNPGKHTASWSSFLQKNHWIILRRDNGSLTGQVAVRSQSPFGRRRWSPCRSLCGQKSANWVTFSCAKTGHNTRNPSYDVCLFAMLHHVGQCRLPELIRTWVVRSVAQVKSVMKHTPPPSCWPALPLYFYHWTLGMFWNSKKKKVKFHWKVEWSVENHISFFAASIHSFHFYSGSSIFHLLVRWPL